MRGLAAILSNVPPSCAHVFADVCARRRARVWMHTWKEGIRGWREPVRADVAITRFRERVCHEQ